MHQEIKNKTKELEKGAAKGSKEVDKARNTTQKHIELLGQHTAAFASSGGKVEPANDPYIIQRGIRYRLSRQILEENNNKHDLIAVQDSFKSFEAHIIATLQQAMQAFLQSVDGQAENQKAMYADIVATTQKIPPDFEWNGFLKRNQGTLIDPNAPLRSVSNISFPNQDHHATRPLIAGSLERKSRVALKGYDTGYYVVTSSKYLHQFKDDDDFRTDPTPDLSLYLPDCNIGAISGEKFNIKGKDASKGKVGSAMAVTSEFHFRAHTPSDVEKWYAVIKSAAGEANVTGSLPTSRVESRNVSGTQQQQQLPPSSGTGAGAAAAKKQPAPLQTTAPQQHTGYQASPITGTPSSGTAPVSAGGVGHTPTGATPTSGLPGKPGQY